MQAFKCIVPSYIQCVSHHKVLLVVIFSSKMDGEIQRFMVVWVYALFSLGYCHTLGKLISPGKIRFLGVLPVILLFLYLPLNLTTSILGGPTSFFLSWLSTFRLMLFAFGEGPLFSSPALPLLSFFIAACLPIKIQANKTDLSNKTHKPPLNYAVESLIFATMLPIYQNRDHIHPFVLNLLYTVIVYVEVELFFAIVAGITRACVGLEFEPQFNEPYLATSLQDFWGKRWNLMVSATLHQSIYKPVRKFLTHFIGWEFATVPAIIATFLVSGLMHELIFYHIGRKRPTWDLTCFFVLHGVCLAMEVVLKRRLNGRLKLPWFVAGPAVVTFTMVTSAWLFAPAFKRSECVAKTNNEATAVFDFIKGIVSYLSQMGIAQRYLKIK